MTSQLATRACPACTGKEKSLLHHQRFVLPAGYPVRAGYDVVYCLRCGMMFADFPSSQAELDTYYGTQAKIASVPERRNPEHSPDYIRHKKFCQWVETLGIGKSTRILDGGCGNGGVLRLLRNAGYQNLYGMDPVRECCEIAHLCSGAECRDGSFSSHQWGDETFDVIISTQVLEHIYDLAAIIGDMKKLLSPEGMILIEVPDLERAEQFLADTAFDFNYEHINFFTPRTLANAMLSNGFQSVGVSQHTVPFSQDYLSPMLCGAYKLSNVKESVVFDPSMPELGINYIRHCEDVINRLGGQVAGFLADRDQWVIWCTTSLTARLLAYGYIDSHRMACIIDNNPKHRGTSISGIPVLHPLDAECRAVLQGEGVGILCYYWYFGSDIVHSIRERWGLNNPVVIMSPAGVARTCAVNEG